MAKKLDEMEGKIFEKNTVIGNLVEKVTSLEEKQINLIEEAKGKYRCNKCDFETYHKTGLKIHKKKKHGSKSCEACDEIFDLKYTCIHTFTQM